MCYYYKYLVYFLQNIVAIRGGEIVHTFFVPSDDVNDEEECKRIENEIRQHFEKVAKEKKSDDFSFDDEYNTAIEAMYYEAESNYVMFIEMEYRFDYIYQYYQYTKRYVASYEKIASEFYNKLLEEDYYDVFVPNGELIHLNCQSTILMVYSAFEAFLRQFIEFIDDKAGVLKYPYDEKTTLKYLNFLNYEKHIFVPRQLYKEFDEIRLVRNFYAHSLDDIQYSLKRYLQKDPYEIMVGDSRIIVNYNYIEHVFDVLGRMVKAIEKAFKKNYPGLNP